MGETQQPAAWIIAKPTTRQMGEARRVFDALCRDVVSPDFCNVPHLTLELLYPPLIDLASIEQSLAEVARSTGPLVVPAFGVLSEASNAILIELARTPELVDLRARLARSLRAVGATIHEGSIESWRPHLSVVGRQHPDLHPWSRVAPNEALVGFSFEVASLILSRRTPDPGVFRESRPFWLGATARHRASGTPSRQSV